MKKINTATTATCLLTCAVLAARADVERLAFDGWLSDEDQKMSADVELNSITGAAGWLGGGWVDASTVAGQPRRWVADGYFFDRGENALSFDLQSDDEGRSTTVKGVRIVLTRKHDGVYARIAQAGYQRKGARGAERLPPTEVPIATSATADGYGVDGLVLLTAGDRRVAFPGYFTSDAKSLGWQSLGGMTDFRAVISGGYAMFAQHAEGQRGLGGGAGLGDDVDGEALALAQADDVVQVGGADAVAAEVDLQTIFQLVVVHTLNGFHNSACTQIAAADAGHDQNVRVLADLGSGCLDAGELFLVVIPGQGHPAQKIAAGAVLGFQLLVGGFYLRVDGCIFLFADEAGEVFRVQCDTHFIKTSKRSAGPLPCEEISWYKCTVPSG